MSVKSLYLIVAMLSLTILVGLGVMISTFKGNSPSDQTVGQPKGGQVKYVSKTVDPKSTVMENTSAVETEPPQGLCCFVDASLDATASNAEDCMPKYTGAACAEWAKWKTLNGKEDHAEKLASWEYHNIRWPTLPRKERPIQKRYHALLVPSVWGFTYKCSTFAADDAGIYVGTGTQSACQNAHAEYESGDCLAQNPCVETSDGGKISEGVNIVDTAKHEAKMAEIQAESDTEMRSARWHRCRDRADEDMDDDMKLNCRFNKKTRIYLCDRYFLQHEKDLRQRAYDACDRACPMCQDD